MRTIPLTSARSNQDPLVLNQSYVYDSLNRLLSAEETAGGTSAWKQTFSFDRYGNRRFDQANTSFPSSFSNTAVSNPAINTSDNRFTSGQGYTYDAAGNVLTDAEGRSFTYDAENKQKEVKNASNQTIGLYYFDGDGRRVKKVTNTETVIFVFDAAGKLVAEYSTSPSETPQVQYLTNDHLDTPRINTNENGAVVSRTDYMPYGEEIIGLGGRSTTDKYVTDDVRQGFTGYLNDEETGLDYAQARMYKKELGRFTGADPFAGLVSNPQSHNKYTYSWNRPLILTDPTGLVVSWEDSEKKKKKGEIEGRTDAQRKYEEHLDEMINSKDQKTRDRGLRLKATYEKLQKSDITFHVVKENAEGSSSGELSYKGEKGHLYVNLKGKSSEYGALPLIQKLGHEFKHGEQFLDGQIAFAQNAETGKWEGYRDDNVDEAEAWIAGFDAQPAGPDQRSGTAGEFVNSIANAYPFGVDAVAKALNESSGSYKGRGLVQMDIKEKYWKGGVIPPNVYAIPRK